MASVGATVYGVEHSMGPREKRTKESYSDVDSILLFFGGPILATAPAIASTLATSNTRSRPDSPVTVRGGTNGVISPSPWRD